MPATLFVVSTPIGNLEDVTLRALRTLREVTLVAAEDTRRTRKLLDHYEITTPMVSLHEHNEREQTPALLERLRRGEAVALVSDAGTPLLSDPGFHLVREAIGAGIRIEAVPGASAVTAALAVSGLPAERFTFCGFPPARSVQRAGWFANLAAVPGTLVLFEAPHRIVATLQELGKQLGDRYVVLARELTKVHETVSRGWVSDLVAGAIDERGEYAILVSDQTRPPATSTATVSVARLRAEFCSMTDNEGFTPRDAVVALARRYQVPKQHVYKALR